MGVRRYECVIIVDVQMADDAREVLLKEVGGIVADTGGSVIEVVPFGIRKLGVELKGRTRGDYRVMRFQSGGETLQRLERALRLKDDVLRFMIARYETLRLKRKTKPRKPKKVEAAIAETEGEASHGKSEQSIPDRQHNATA